MNRIEQKMSQLKQKNEKAFMTYMMAGLPDMEGTKRLIRAQEASGVDVLELGIPFSDPVADGPVVQKASYQSICLGTNLKKAFCMMEEIRSEGVTVPVIFRMYYNTILSCGIGAFAEKCRNAGVDGVVVPDLPLEEQEALQKALDKEEGAILIQLASPASGARIPVITEHARGFLYCISSMSDTRQDKAFGKNTAQYFREVKAVSKIPVVMGFGGGTPEDIAPMQEYIDGVASGSRLIQLLDASGYSIEAVKEYCGRYTRSLKQNL